MKIWKLKEKKKFLLTLKSQFFLKTQTVWVGELYY